MRRLVLGQNLKCSSPLCILAAGTLDMRPCGPFSFHILWLINISPLKLSVEHHLRLQDWSLFYWVCNGYFFNFLNIDFRCNYFHSYNNSSHYNWEVNNWTFMPGAISNSPTTSNIAIITRSEEEVQIPHPILVSTFSDQWNTHVWTVLSLERRPRGGH